MILKKLFFLFFIGLLLVTSGCQKYSEFKKITPRRMALLNNDCHIESAKVMKWHVGLKRDITISKGIQLKIGFPYIRREDLAYLSKAQGINSWVVKVSRMVPTRPAEEIGIFYVPLLVPRGKGQMTSVFRAKQLEFAYFNVYYSAAAISKRFEDSHCPVFNHTRYIEDLNIVRSPASSSTIAINTAERERFTRKVERFGYRPLVLNGGMSLRGRYVVDIALYNFKTKMKQSTYIRLPEELEVPFEGNKVVKECIDFKIPSPKPGFDNLIRRFRWKREDKFLE